MQQISMMQPPIPKTPVERWQYTEQDWLHENGFFLKQLYLDICDKIHNTGANASISTYEDFCHYVLLCTWVPQMGLHVPGKKDNCSEQTHEDEATFPCYGDGTVGSKFS